MSNQITKTFKTPWAVNDIYAASGGNLLLCTATSVALYDVAQKKVAAELATPPIKYAVWSADMSMVALLGKHTIVIATKFLEEKCIIHETIRIKSGAWDETGIFIYSNLNHIKYSLLQGDTGIIKTLDQPIYIIHVRGKTLYCLDRDAKTRTITIDRTEYRFKLALIRRNYDDVMHMINNSNLMGQSIIAYLQKKGYSDIALNFVRDSQTRFQLALECGKLDVALETAKDIDRKESWDRLADEAIRVGDHKTAGLCYQKTKSFEKLSFLYLITGNTENLKKMLKIAQHRGDGSARYQTALYLGDAQDRVMQLRELGLTPLAYFTAKTNGLDELAQQVLEEAGIVEEEVLDIPVPEGRSVPLLPPQVVNNTFEETVTHAKPQASFQGNLTNEVNGFRPRKVLLVTCKACHQMSMLNRRMKRLSWKTKV